MSEPLEQRILHRRGTAAVRLMQRWSDMRVRCSPTQMRLRGGVRRLAAVLVFAGLSATNFSAPGQPVILESSDVPYHISLYWYGDDGTLRAGLQKHREAIHSVFYGAPITNILFRTNLPAPHSTSDEPSAADSVSIASNSLPSLPSSPQFQLDNWTTQDGLPADKVNAVLQTSDGYLWVGTVAGLARFDGVRFKVFDEGIVPEYSNIGFNVRALYEDEEEKLWIGTRGGLLCRANGRFVPFSGQESLSGTQVLCFTRRDAGGFWFGANDRIGFWDGQRLRWGIGPSLDSGDRVLALTEGPENILWAGSLSGLYRIDLDDGVVTGPIQRDGQLPDNQVSVGSLLVDREGMIWVGASDGGWWIDSPDAQPRRIYSANLSTSSFLQLTVFAEDSQGIIWAATPFGGGLVRLSSEPGLINATRHAQEIGDSLCITVDVEGAIWIGSRHQGLYRLTPCTFNTWAFQPRSELNRIRWVAEDSEGGLWFANDRTLIHWAGRKLWLFDANNLDPGSTPPISTAGCAAGEMWTDFPLGGIFEPPRSENDPRFLFPVTPRFSEIGRVQVIHALRDSTILLGTDDGLYRVTEIAPPQKLDKLGHLNVLALQEDQNDRLWIGTRGQGLVCWRDGEVRAFTRQDGLADDDVLALHLDGNNQLWIGTEAGLCLYGDEGCFSFEESSGVPQEPVYSILEDEHDRVWIAHGEGITRVPRRELEQWVDDRTTQPAVTQFDVRDGLPSLGISDGARPVALKGRDGRLWFATRGGLSVVDPDDCPLDIPAPQVFIESILAGDQTVRFEGATPLPPGSGRHVAIRFTATSLRQPNKVRLRYRLDGFDQDWRESNEDRRAVYANLGPGQYQFRVQACNFEGRWSEQDATFAFSILPYFWQTRTFYGAAGGGVVMSVAGLILWRTWRERQRSKTERARALETERLRIARDMHDHLGAQLAGLALASEKGDAAHQRARETLSELNDLIWSVNPSNDTLPSLADFISNFASRFLHTAGLGLDLDFPDTIPPIRISSRVRHELAGMLKEALRNVSQHAQAKSVVIRLRIETSEVVLTVSDDGCGFDTAVLTTPTRRPEIRSGQGRMLEHMGLGNFQTRSRRLGGRCRIKSGPGKGTEVEIVVPLNDKN